MPSRAPNAGPSYRTRYICFELAAPGGMLACASHCRAKPEARTCAFSMPSHRPFLSSSESSRRSAAYAPSTLPATAINFASSL
eukprot:3351694-Rhodomonas_salina.2